MSNQATAPNWRAIWDEATLAATPGGEAPTDELLHAYAEGLIHGATLLTIEELSSKSWMERAGGSWAARRSPEQAKHYAWKGAKPGWVDIQRYSCFVAWRLFPRDDAHLIPLGAPNFVTLMNLFDGAVQRWMPKRITLIRFVAHLLARAQFVARQGVKGTVTQGDILDVIRDFDADDLRSLWHTASVADNGLTTDEALVLRNALLAFWEQRVDVAARAPEPIPSVPTSPLLDQAAVEERLLTWQETLDGLMNFPSRLKVAADFVKHARCSQVEAEMIADFVVARSMDQEEGRRRRWPSVAVGRVISDS